MGSTELLYLPFSNLFHSLADLIDFTPDHIVQLAIIPDELNVCKGFLIRGVLARYQFLFAGGEIHRALDYLRVIKEAHLYKKCRVWLLDENKS